MRHKEPVNKGAFLAVLFAKIKKTLKLALTRLTNGQKKTPGGGVFNHYSLAIRAFGS